VKQVEGGITAPIGFRASGVSAGIKKQGKDVAVIYSETLANAAAVFTTNAVKAAPVLWSQRTLQGKLTAQAIVINSGNANACTGKAGLEHAIQMCETVANQLSIRTDDVLVASTGVIGVPLPIDRVCNGIMAACETLDRSPEAATSAAEAIMTTDTCSKQVAVSILVDGKTVTIGGMAKGSGMIHPNMATMLGFITTDVSIDGQVLQQLLRETVAETYNMISVDGDTSTNDTVFVLANGQAGNNLMTEEHVDFERFREAFRFVNTFLAKQIVQDGEGATKLLEVRVHGAASTEDARKLAKAIINSNLVKTAFFGEDANWGRILAAMGYSGVAFDVSGVSIAFESRGGRIVLMEHGEPEIFDEETASRILREREIVVEVQLHEGDASATGWGCDLSYEYVRINGDYRT
jgi:glutamate N-acetyltransferase/amino-acid N-acetyltransferase